MPIVATQTCCNKHLTTSPLSLSPSPAGTWMVVLAALISSTMLNCIFPFFTYVESSGLLGEFLPQVTVCVCEV